MTGSLKTREADLTKQNTDLKAQNAELTTQVANLKAQMIILMSRLMRVGISPGGGGGGNFTPDSGWSSPSFDGSNNFTISRDAADLGTGPTILIFADFSGGVDGNTISSAAVVGSFTYLTDSTSPNNNSGTNKPTYKTGPDGRTWMNTLNPTVIAADEWCLAEIVSGVDYDTFYCSNRQYYDGSGTLGTSNQKDIWHTYNGDTGATHDIYGAANNGIFGNTSDAFYFDDSQADAPQVSPANSGAFRRLTNNFRSFGVKPHSSAAYQALSDVFFQTCDPTSGRLQSSETNKESAFQNNVSPFAWNHIYLPGVYQDQQTGTHEAGPPYATYYLWNDLLIQTGANAWKRFFVTNASTLAASTFIADCPHTTWAAGQVTIRKPGSISNWAGYYVWYGNGISYTRVGVGT